MFLILNVERKKIKTCREKKKISTLILTSEYFIPLNQQDGGIAGRGDPKCFHQHMLTN
jgi:hypothetical protein